VCLLIAFYAQVKTIQWTGINDNIDYKANMVRMFLADCSNDKIFVVVNEDNSLLF